MSEGSQYEIFEAAKMNNIKRVRELLDAGVSVNLVDPDNGNTPLHYATSNGAKQTMEFLLQKGAEINAINERGVTPVMNLVTKRYDALALWLIKQGADHNIPDKKGFSSRDYALGWFQKEMDEPEEKAPDPQEKRTTQSLGSLNDEVLRIYLTNGAYKAVNANPKMTTESLASLMAEKIGLPANYGGYLEVYEVKRDQPRKLQPGEGILEARSKWPLIFGKTGNETHLHCKFLIKVKMGAPAEVQQKYDSVTTSS